MDFMDDEAEVGTSEDEEEMEGDEGHKKKRPRAISSDEDEDEEDDEEKAREEMKGFIADDDDEDVDDGSDDGEVRRSKKKKKKPRSRSRSRSDEEEDIDDEDRELLKENLGYSVQKKRKRIRVESGSDRSDSDRGAGDDSGNVELPDPDAVGEGGESGNESDDFIVGEDGRPIKSDRKKRKAHIFADEPRQLAEDVFGVQFDYGEFEQYGDDDDDIEEEDYEEDEEDEEGGAQEKKAARRRKKKPVTDIFSMYEPEELERHQYTHQDNEIRNTDIPERMQLREVPLTEPDDPEEYNHEAEWIYSRLTKPTISKQARINEKGYPDKENVVEKIRNVLVHLRQDKFEVPFINQYRQEYYKPELITDDLWRIYELDAEWCKLLTRKKNCKKLYERCQTFQGETLFATADSEIPDHVRIVQPEDLDRIDTLTGFEELKDHEQQFKFYYANDRNDIVAFMKKKRKEERETQKTLKKFAKKNKKAKKMKTITNEEGEEVQVTDDEQDDDDNDVDDDNEVEDEKAAEEEEEEDDDFLKHAIRNNPVSMCRKLGLCGMANEFGLKPFEFGENLQDGYQKVDVDQVSRDPVKLAEEYCERSPKLSPDQAPLALEHVKRLVASQIAHEPKVRSVVRDAFFERARFSVRPTKKGMKEIDENHNCDSLKYLTDMPVRDLHGDEWVRLVQAEEQKLITIDMAKDINSYSQGKSFLQEAQELYRHDAFSKSVQEWNNLRKECVEIAFTKILYPMFRTELRNKLTREAKDGVLKKIRDKVFDLLKVSRYAISFDEEDEDDWGSDQGCRIMAVMYENDVNVAAYAAVVTPEGEVSGYVKFDNLLKRKNSWNERDRAAKEADLAVLTRFIRNKRPHVIVVGSADLTARSVKEDVEACVGDLVNGDAQFPKLEVHLLDDNLAKVFANSTVSEHEFREFPSVLKQAVSLARRMQDPLVEFSQLTGKENEIVCLRYHPLQDALSEDELLAAIHVEFINRVCEVGVDINECVAHPHMSNLVQFVGGLGPRKAAALLKTLRQLNTSQRLENRSQLVTHCHMGGKVLMNCSGFIKINTANLGDSDVYVEVLDGSRIHYEAYDWAKKMAVDALEYDEDEGNPANALEEILQEPEKLAELDLEAFAQELERQDYGKRHITLYNIRAELHDMYKDFRAPFVEPSPEEVFNLLTKESPATFYVGKLIMATVVDIVYKMPQGDELDRATPLRKGEGSGTDMWQCPICGQDDFLELTEVWNHIDAKFCRGKAVGVKIRLDNGISGFIPMRNLSDSQVMKPEERVSKNQSIYCRIAKIQPERFSIEAICKSSALEDKENEWRPRKSSYYDFEAEAADTIQDREKRKKQQKQSYVKRVIVHPNFKNIDYRKAEKILDNLEKDPTQEDVAYQQGDVIIRPSSKGEDHLTVTWKVTQNIHQHIDVLEKNKTNSFSLGQSLWIGEEEFEDLDEIIARHINPMASHARDLLNFKYYRDTEGGKREVAEESLRQEKRNHPGKIHYILSASRELPGKFMLSYMPRTKARHEFITVQPDGFRFRKQNFDSLSQLFKWFKEHFRDPIPGTPMTPGGGRTSTQRTPYMTGTPGGAITPGAMSMAAANTPFSTATPGAGYSINTPYTPSGQTPILTPYNTPGPAAGMTPRGNTGSATPRSHMAPPPMPPPTSQRRSNPVGYQQSPSYGRSPAHRPTPDGGWQAAVDGWMNRGGRSGRNTPRGNDGSATPQGYRGSLTPHVDEAGQRTPGGSKRTPRAFDSTPLYDE